MIKKILTLALGFALITPAFNVKALDKGTPGENVLAINALSKNDAKNLRQLAAVISTISSTLVAANGTEQVVGRTVKPIAETIDFNRIANLSSTLYFLLASAMEDGDLYMKGTSIVQKAGAAKTNGLANPEGWEDSDVRKDVVFAILTEAIKQAAHTGVDIAQAKAADAKLVKQDQRIIRRAVRAVTYALTDAVTEGGMKFLENKCRETNTGLLATTYEAFLKSVITNALFEAAGELIALEIIE